MIKIQQLPYYLLSISLLFLGACTEDDPDLEGDPQGSNIVVIDNDITEVTHWVADSLYLIDDNDLWISNTLTIDSGTVIKFRNDSHISLGSSGTILARGTAGKPIIFTSYKDDSFGGDTNADADLTSPAASDWAAIDLQDQLGSVFTQCRFLYGGNSSNKCTLTCSVGAAATITHCVFAYNDGGLDMYGVLNLNYGSSGMLVQNNIFYGNKRPLSISTSISLDNSNVFHNPELLTETNKYNGIFVYDNDMTEDFSWEETEVAFVIDDNDLWIDQVTMTLGDNVVLKFKSASTLVLADGSSNISNYDGTGVAFTSYKNDSLKGDTNGDDALTTPTIGDWDGIYDDTRLTAPYYVDWVNIDYAAN